MSISDGEPSTWRSRPLFLVALVIAGLVVGGLGVIGVRVMQNRDPGSGTVVGTGDAGSTADPTTPTESAEATTGAAPQPPSAGDGSPSGQPSAGNDGSGVPDTGPAAAAAPAASEEIDAYDASVGDCLGNPGDTPTVQTVIRVPCEQTHHSEVFAAFDLSGTPYPGDRNVEADAMKGCNEKFTDFVGLHRSESRLDFSFMTPTESTWATGDRAVTCLVYNPKASTTGTLANSRK